MELKRLFGVTFAIFVTLRNIPFAFRIQSDRTSLVSYLKFNYFFGLQNEEEKMSNPPKRVINFAKWHISRVNYLKFNVFF